MSRLPAFICGIDWSEGLNDVAVISRDGAVVTRARIEESPQGVTDLFRLLDGLRNSHTHGRRHVPIGIETADGLLAATLRARRQPVIHIPPHRIAAMRKSLSPVPRKSDRTDAEIIALAVRDGWGRLRPQPVDSPQATAIGVLIAAHDRTQRTRLRLQAQLRSLLRQGHPHAVTAWTHLDHGLARPEARAVLAAAPNAATAAKLTQYRLTKILAAAGRRRLVDAEAYRLRDLFTLPVLRLDPAVETAMAAQISAVLGLFDAACHTEQHLRQQIAAQLALHPQAAIYLSFPGCGTLLAARLLGEIGDDPTRFATAKGLRGYAGLSPVTWASGSSKVILHRRVCNRRLKTACHQWAFSALTRSPGCRAVYDTRRAHGDTFPGALRHVAGRLLAGLHHCLATGELYDERAAFGGIAPP
ncbi:IS110 family transposase [Hamadaea sp. NPDC050747]|uniref:IS110 family transposase n=1 Tax=Hamadaea sp. NPDC050747 TaxID=3155789 RepID=UPI0033DC322F